MPEITEVFVNESELKKVQKISLDMAVEFSHFCEEHGLLCYLCGGGCIGAIRHKGMIPWDDDLDFFMPREDYETFWQLWQQEKKDSRYALEKPSEKLVTHCLFIKLRDKETTYIYDYQREVDTIHGVALDILPLDGYPSSKPRRFMQCVWAYLYSLYCAQLVPVNHGKLVALAGKLMLWMVPGKCMRYRIWNYAQRQMTKYSIHDCEGITELCSGPGYMKNYYSKEIFSKSIKVPFENTEFPIPVGYDQYLKTAFGDYMKLPPKENQIQQHEAAFMDLNRSYKYYKGVKWG